MFRPPMNPRRRWTWLIAVVCMVALLRMVGEVTRDASPEEKVFILGETWNAVSDEPLMKGEMVEVVAVDKLKLKVQKISAR